MSTLLFTCPQGWISVVSSSVLPKQEAEAGLTVLQQLRVRATSAIVTPGPILLPIACPQPGYHLADKGLGHFSSHALRVCSPMSLTTGSTLVYFLSEL